MTRPVSPSRFLVRAYGDVLTGLGATKLSPVDSHTLKATWVDNAMAVNATAAFNDLVLGVKLIVDNQSTALDRPVPSHAGVQALVRQLPKVDATIVAPRRRGDVVPNMLVSGPDTHVVSGLRLLLRSKIETPRDGSFRTHVFHKPQAEPARP